MTIKFGSLFSGIGGFDLGFERAGMSCAWQCEIDKRCQEVLKKHWDVKIYDDVREITKENTESVDVICGGFPCQDVSVAGNRKGLAGERSGLWFEYLRVLSELTPRWVVIENVPGLLSSNRGRDFAVILSGLAELGYFSSWRILDAQYFGVPQRRRRVFIVGSLGNGDSAKILFESESMSGNIEKGKKNERDISGTISTCSGRASFRGRTGENMIAIPVLSREGQSYNPSNSNFIWDFHRQDGTYRPQSNTMPTVHSKYGTGGNNMPFVGVRRLTPVECAKLQGFPGNWNDLMSDSARYRQFGNAVCVPVAEWIGKRIIEEES